MSATDRVAAAKAGPGNTPELNPEISPHTLATLVHDCARSGVGRRVLLVRLDSLPSSPVRANQRRLARDAIEGLTRADRALLHELPNGALAVSWKGEAPAALDEAMAALIAVFDTGRRTGPLSNIIALYDLPREGRALLHVTGGFDVPAAPTVKQAPEPLEALRSTGLDQLEKLLGAADIARFVRRKPVCRRSASGWDLAWEKRSLSMAEIAETLAPAHDITADAWLFRRLTRVLDRRMLALLAAPRELDGVRPFSLDLNIGSILGPGFLRFDAGLPARLRGHIVLDIALSDIVADPDAFSFARNFAHGRGYKLLLREITSALVPLLALPRLDLDFVELVWSPDLPSTVSALPASARPSWVLGNADDAAALSWAAGQSVGLVHGKDIAPTGPMVA